MEKVKKPKRQKWFTFSIYQNKDDGKFIIHWNWSVPHIPLEEIEYSKTPDRHQLVFCGTHNLYWVFFKSWEGKYKWFRKTRNDHTNCGG